MCFAGRLWPWCLAQLGSAGAASPAQKVCAALVLLLLTLLASKTRLCAHLGSSLCLTVCFCFPVPLCHSLGKGWDFHPTPTIPTSISRHLSVFRPGTHDALLKLSLWEMHVYTHDSLPLNRCFSACFTDNHCPNLIQKSLQRVSERSLEPEPCSQASSDG